MTWLTPYCCWNVYFVLWLKKYTYFASCWKENANAKLRHYTCQKSAHSDTCFNCFGTLHLYWTEDAIVFIFAIKYYFHYRLTFRFQKSITGTKDIQLTTPLNTEKQKKNQKNFTTPKVQLLIFNDQHLKPACKPTQLQLKHTCPLLFSTWSFIICHSSLLSVCI